MQGSLEKYYRTLPLATASWDRLYQPKPYRRDPTSVQWKQRERWMDNGGRSPGPAKYSRSELLLSHQRAPSSVCIGKGGGKSDLEWTIYRAKQVPGPQSYSPPTSAAIEGGRINRAKPKSNLEWIIYRAKNTPGPAEYDVGKTLLPKGGKFSSANPKSDVEWKIYRAKDVPAPGENWRERNFGSSKPASKLLGKVRKSNSQTTIPSDFTSYVHRTINEQGPNQCRTDSSFGKQIHSEQKSASSAHFSSGRTLAGSIFGVPDTEHHYKEKVRRQRKESRRRRRERMARSRRSMETSSLFQSSFGFDPRQRLPAKDMRPKSRSVRKKKTIKKQMRASNRLSRPKTRARLEPIEDIGGWISRDMNRPSRGTSRGTSHGLTGRSDGHEEVLWGTHFIPAPPTEHDENI